jgi:hypothetical protein
MWWDTDAESIFSMAVSELLTRYDTIEVPNDEVIVERRSDE